MTKIKLFYNNFKINKFNNSIVKLFQNYFAITLFVLMLYSCTSNTLNEENRKIEEQPSNPKNISVKESIALSQLWTKDEAYKIKRFVERRNWNPKRTETGIYYKIYKQNPSGKKAKTGDVATITYEIRLLNADTTLCYSSAKGKSEDVIIEMDNVESGLHEALTYMREGERAYVILPHYLAHGLVGDLDKIPPLSPVLYDINLLHLK